MSLYEFEGERPRIHAEAFVHPDAVLIGDVDIDAGCYVGAGAVLRGDIGAIKIGQGSNIQENCSVHTFPDRSTIVHSGTHVGHGCILHGCEIHSNVLVGMGSIIGDDAVIQTNCMIGAGSFVPFKEIIPMNSVAVGSPVKVIKTISLEQLDRIANGLALYQELTRRYLRSFRRITVSGPLN